ncbi:MAG: response regulator [Anaerolineae bacterium]|nr:MAG: response regulator [Anaerolineae bacterium]
MPKKVLIVDDDHSNRLLLYFALKAGDFEIYQAESGEAVQKMANEMTFEMALIDIELPDINGLDLVSLLRDKFENILLIMSTATDDPEILYRACVGGANGYLVKPFDLKQVLTLINQLELQPVKVKSQMMVLGNNARLRLYSINK